MITTFVQHLHEFGEIQLSASLESFTDQDKSNAIDLVKGFYEVEQLNYPGQLAPLDEAAAMWAATHLYRITQFILYRSIDEETIKEKLNHWQNLVPSASEICSVDLFFRHLPALLKFAKGIAPQDYLVQYTNELCHRWHYSSIGISTSKELDWTGILSDESLLLDYADRVILKQDYSRLVQTEINDVISAQIGEDPKWVWPNYYLYQEEKQNDKHN